MRSPILLSGLPALVLLVACGSGSIDVNGDGPSPDCPAARIDVDALEWSGALIGEGETRTFQLTNDCLDDEGDLVAELAVDGDAGFAVSPSSITLGPGEAAEVTVTYTAVDYEPVEAAIDIGTNVEGLAGLQVELVGTTAPDQDGDLFPAIEAGGDDCDDFNAEINPAAAEIWYDGVDQNCDGASDYDQDGDGFDRNPEGADCLDTDPTVNPDGAEDDDLVDDDCDGLVDEDFLRPGDVLVTEVMADPVAVFDTSGEWFEVINTTARTVNLRNWQVTDYGSDEFLIDQDLILEPGGRAVFGVESAPARNGGAEVSFVYSRASFELGNATDVIALEAGDATVSLLEYDVSWSVEPGASLSLDPMFVARDTATVGAYWCAATSPMTGGDAGTPLGANDLCTSVDHDGDGISIDAGDCDDTDGSIYPGARDIWNGIDDDCDGATDDATIDDVEDGYLDGDRREYLGTQHALSFGDVDGDGDDEVLVGTTRAGGTYAGTVYLLDAADADTWSDLAYDVDEAKITGHGSYDTAGLMGSRMGDNDGDGELDVAIGGSTGFRAGTNPAVMLFTDGSALSGTLDEEDADASWYGPQRAYDNAAIASNIDLDGDGTASILFGDPFGTNPDGTTLSGRFYGTLHVLDGAGASGNQSIVDDSELTWYGANYYDYVGTSIVGGDLDGDGYDEAFVCASYADDGSINAGSCYVIAGGTDLESGELPDVAEATISGRASNDRLGWQARAEIANLDGNTKPDLILPNPVKEEVLVFLDAGDLSGDYDTSDADVVIRPRSAPSAFGKGLAVGDFDGDGDDDLAVGAPDTLYFQGFGADEAGGVWVWTGDTIARATGTLDERDAWASVVGDTTADVFGFALLGADFDGDSQDDLAVAAPGLNSGDGRVSFLIGD